MRQHSKEDKEDIADAVSLFKLIWDEVDKQFGSLNLESKIKLYSDILPLIHDMMYPWPDDSMIGEIEEEIRRLQERKEK